MKVKRVGTNLTIIKASPLAIWAAHRHTVSSEGYLRKIGVAEIKTKNTSEFRIPYYFDGKLLIMKNGKIKEIVEAVVSMGNNYNTFRYFYKE